MFPNQNIVSSITELEENNTINSQSKSPVFDFSTGDFLVKNGSVQTTKGYEALKTWIQKILKTEQNKYKIYNTDNVEKYGTNLLELITSDFPLTYIQSQIQTIVTTALLKNSDITTVDNFVFSKDKNLLNCQFNVTSAYGTTVESVVI